MDKIPQSDQLFHAIISGDRKFLENLYAYWRTEFMDWCKKVYGLNEEECSNLYQDAFLHFYMNIKNKKVEEVQYPKTYLFGIAKNLIRQKYKPNKNDMTTLEVVEDIQFEPVNTDPTGIKEELQAVLQMFGEPCKSLLLMFYFENYSHEVIAERLGYKNEGVVKKKKSLCMSELRKMWKKYMKKHL